jgi:hypothetical protein
MHFVRDVESAKLIGGWNDAFKAALGEEKVKKMKAKLDEFNNLMGNIKKGQKILLTFLKEGIKIKFANQQEKNSFRRRDLTQRTLCLVY